MNSLTACPDVPDELFRRRVCLDVLSRDLRGDVRLLETRDETCEEERCTTLKTAHLLHVDAAAGSDGCDTPLADALTGPLYVCFLVHAFADDMLIETLRRVTSVAVADMNEFAARFDDDPWSSWSRWSIEACPRTSSPGGCS